MSTHGNPNLAGAQWRKSSYSNGNGGNCVEVAVAGAHRAVRNSRNPTGSTLMFTATEWAVFTTGVRSGAFD
jgi:hypothetical protein